ncbi:MAG: glycine--tRNA ligase subunit beta [Holophagales bacterium]|jgi:glycyl-tRNA synthetase beta chain|nr:glycine--tRNA ligase subunit beta [Holophagales bacterium]
MTDTQTLLLEIHCEEIPARFLKPLSAEFEAAFLNLAKEQKLGEPSVQAIFSPRKLAWRVEGLFVAQSDQVEKLIGPPKRMCVDESGKPTVQGQKFAEKCGVDFSALRFEQPAGKKEPCAVAEILKKGRNTDSILSEALPRLVSALHVPKAMRWGSSSYEFVRPIRSILCTFGKKTVPFTIDGVNSGNTTWGHRLFHRTNESPLTVDSPEKYEAVLKAGGIIASFEERRRTIEEQIKAKAAEVGGRPVADEELLDTLALIVEWPSMLKGAFPPEFMDLPKEVLVTSLKEHQKAFCIEKPDGSGLLPYFLAIANRPDDPQGLIVAGNEWVLKARLYDARFFFAEDRRAPLSSLAPKLEALTFHRELGSYAEKTQRISNIAIALAKKMKLDIGHAKAASELCKADLVTLMVGEFPELQGIMGGCYLQMEGAPQSVWQAVREHYMPLGAEAPLPSSGIGAILAIADKLDTLSGCFAIGMVPSGSKDPLALRRAGMGIVRILWEKGFEVSVDDLVAIGLEAVSQKAKAPIKDTQAALMAFFKDRVAYQLELCNIPPPVRNSAIASGWADLNDLKARCAALSKFAQDQRFESLGSSAKRIANILKDENAESLEKGYAPNLLEQAEEKTLASRLTAIEGAKDYGALLALLADLAQPLEEFFNKVMVKCEDKALRNARLSLLHKLRKSFMKIADFGLWH